MSWIKRPPWFCCFSNLPYLAVVLTALSVGAWAWAWTARLVRLPEEGAALLLALPFAVAIWIAGCYPIHLRNNTKVYLSTVPLYMTALLLPPPVAALAAGTGILASSLATRTQRGTLPVDIVTDTARGILVQVAAASVGQTLEANGFMLLALACTGGVMFLGDLVTGALEIAQMSGESPWQVLRANLREAGSVEGAQYLLGLLGVFVGRQHPWALILLVIPCLYVYQAFKRSRELQESTRRLLETMADTVDLRDPYTGGHSRRVTEWTGRILNEMQVYGPEASLILSAARVHDIGKIGIPDAILLKPDRLSPEEEETMRSHPTRGAELLARYIDFSRGVEIVRHHHERWDGQGYPHRLRGYEIPLGARVIAVADAFDAMTTERPYRHAISRGQALSLLQEGAHTQWDGKVVTALTHVVVGQVERAETPAVQTLEPEWGTVPVSG